MTINAAQSYAAGHGIENAAFGLPRTIRVRAADSGGAIGIWTETVQPGAGPPPHRHTRETEIFQIVEGTFCFRFGGEEREFGAGDIVVVPPGVPHSFVCSGESAGRMVVSVVPGGFEEFFLEVEAEGLVPPDDMPRIIEIAKTYGLEFVLPG